MSQPKQSAIEAALQQNWEKAIDLNLNCLDNDNRDIDALNRLAFAYFQTGQVVKAKKTYKQTLSIDKYNLIAKKSLDKIKHLKSSIKASTPALNQPINTSFIEEPGKTKSVNLLRTAGPNIILTLRSGTPVSLVSKNRRINIETQSGTYLGSLPDDLAFSLNKFIKVGYKYSSWIKSTSGTSVCIFIKELAKSKKGKSLPSFPHTTVKIPTLTKTRELYEPPIDLTPTGEDESDHKQ